MIWTLFQFKNLFPEQLLLPWLHERLCLSELLHVVGKCFLDVFLDFPDLDQACKLVLLTGVKCGFHAVAPLRLDLFTDCAVKFRSWYITLFLANECCQLFNLVDDLLASLVSASNGLDHILFGNFG